MRRNTRPGAGFKKMSNTFTDFYGINIPLLPRTLTFGTEVAPTMKQHVLRFATAAAFAAGMAMAQAPAAPNAAADPAHPRAGRAWAARRGVVRQRMAQALNLSDAQKEQA